VPVLLNAASWDPVLTTLDAWILQAISSVYYNRRPEIPAELLRNGLLIPILDGIDEIPDEARRSAIRAINKAVVLDRPIVITCREAEFDDLIEGGSPSLRSASVLTVQPVAPSDVASYFNGFEWPSGGDWTGVLQRIKNRQDPLAEALSTPLMVHFARIVFQRLEGRPGELLDRDRFDSRHTIEDYLTDKLVEAAYRPTSGDDPAALDRASRSLVYIAKHLHRYREVGGEAGAAFGKLLAKITTERSLERNGVRVIQRLYSYGLNYSEVGWRMQATANHQLAGDVRDLEFVAQIPPGGSLTGRFFIAADIAVRTTADRWLTAGFSPRRRGPVLQPTYPLSAP
jgi:hypothetical protein